VSVTANGAPEHDPNAQIAGTLVRCQLCLEPAVDVNGVWLHVFSGNTTCTYRSYL
jgi:hypothetical protein